MFNNPNCHSDPDLSGEESETLPLRFAQVRVTVKQSWTYWRLLTRKTIGFQFRHPSREALMSLLETRRVTS